MRGKQCRGDNGPTLCVCDRIGPRLRRSPGAEQAERWHFPWRVRQPEKGQRCELFWWEKAGDLEGAWHGAGTQPAPRRTPQLGLTVGHFRRYTREGFARLWAKLAAEPLLLSHFNARLYPGEADIFATATSLALGVAVYDTQCGAKLFRATPRVRSLFAEAFRSRWIFDGDLFARLVRRRIRQDGPPVREIVYELPLDAWPDIGGSRLRGADFARAAVELGEIWWRYLRPGVRTSESPGDLQAAPSSGSHCRGEAG